MINKLLLLTFFITLTLWLAIAFTPLEIKSNHVAAGLLVAVIVTGITCLGRFLHQWSSSTAITTASLLTAFLSVAAYFLIWSSGWVTQDILYQHRRSANRTIEFQMTDVGALGYGRRMVDQRKLLPGIYWITELGKGAANVENSKLDSLDWKEVHFYKNELGLKDQ